MTYIIRNNTEKEIVVVLTNRTGYTEIVKVNTNEIIKGLGADFNELSAGERKEIEIESGIKVSRLSPGEFTEQTGIRKGFILTKVDNKKTNSADDLIAALKKSDGGVLLEGIYPQNPNEKVFYDFAL